MAETLNEEYNRLVEEAAELRQYIAAKGEGEVELATATRRLREVNNKIADLRRKLQLQTPKHD